MSKDFDRRKTIQELEKLAIEVNKLKQEREQRRPLLIEFCGSPKSGKSTTINSLNIFLKRNNFKTVILSERAGICPIENKTHPFFNIWTLTSAIAEIVKHLDQGKEKIDIIISDRGIFDALCWFEWLNKNPNENNPYLDDKAYEDLRHFILMDFWSSYLDLIYVFQVKPNTSIKREYANLLTDKRGSIMREDILEGFNKATDFVIDRYSKEFRKVEKIITDTKELDDDPNTVGYEVAKNILGILKDLFIEKIGYFCESLKSQLNYGVNLYSDINLPEMKFDNRDKVEDSNNIQPIAIAVVTNPERNKVLVVKKSSKGASKDSPESEKLLLYIGGHVRQEDAKNDHDVFSTLEKTLKREIQEEIGEALTIKKAAQPFFIYTPENIRSAKHMAVCYLIEMNLDEKKFKLVSDEFIKKTGNSKSGHIIKISELKNKNSKQEFEPWSKVILEHIFNIKIKDLFNN